MEIRFAEQHIFFLSRFMFERGFPNRFPASTAAAAAARGPPPDPRRRKVPSRRSVAMRQCLLPTSWRPFLQFTAARWRRRSRDAEPEAHEERPDDNWKLLRDARLPDNFVEIVLVVFGRRVFQVKGSRFFLEGVSCYMLFQKIYNYLFLKFNKYLYWYRWEYVTKKTYNINSTH